MMMSFKMDLRKDFPEELLEEFPEELWILEDETS